MNSSNAIVDFTSLIEWYRANCNDDWEHRYGIKLETLDNPGWLLIVDLVGTSLQGKSMPTLNEGCDPAGNPMTASWIHGTAANNQFRAACDPDQIARLFQLFEAFREDYSQ